jgi:hypothetical protein
MFRETLFGNTQENLAILGRSPILKAAYLAGGTAAALQLGHRISVDLDFFTAADFNPRAFVQELSSLGEFAAEQAGRGTVAGRFRGVKFSLFTYKYPVIYPFKNFSQVKIASLQDIAAMKIDAIATRGAKRDFVDLYFIAKRFPLKKLLQGYERKFRKLAPNLMHIKKSLVYFEDAEAESMPRMLKKIGWQEVRGFFEQEVKKLVG